MSSVGKLMRQAQRIQQQMETVQASIAQKTIEATSGGGKVVVKATGSGEITSIKIDPQVVDPKDVEMLEDLVLSAVRQAVEDAKKMAGDEMGKLTGGLKIPGLSM